MSLVKLLGAVDGNISIKTHLKGAFGLSGILDLAFFFHFALMYTTDHIFPVLPIKYLIKKYGDPTTSHKLTTGTKPSVSHLRLLFCPCGVRKATAHVETKTLNMRHQAQKGFRGIFVGIPEH